MKGDQLNGPRAKSAHGNLLSNSQKYPIEYNIIVYIEIFTLRYYDGPPYIYIYILALIFTHPLKNTLISFLRVLTTEQLYFLKIF